MDAQPATLPGWLLRVSDRPPIQHRLEPAGLSPCFRIVVAPELLRIQQFWHDVFPLMKPFADHDQPFSGDDVWDPLVEARWCGFLHQHLECFDSLDILDDLVTALGRHTEAQPAHIETLLLRSVALIDLACQGMARALLPWAIEDNRLALRALFRLFQQQADGRNTAAAILTGGKLLRLNPTDDHAVGPVLAMLVEN